MTIGEMIRRNREEEGLSREELADRLGLPLAVLVSLEDPQAENPVLVAELAKAFGVEDAIVTGEKRRPTKEELQDAHASRPNIRRLILAAECCVNVEDARELIGSVPFSPLEQTVVLHLATAALNHFQEESYSSFALDEYLFKRHGELLKRLEKSLAQEKIGDQEKEERMALGQTNVFSCDSPANIAGMILGEFTEELEEKLAAGKKDFVAEVGMPFVWEVDKEQMQIEVRSPDGETRATVTVRATGSGKGA